MRSDIIRKRMHEVDPETRLPESAYTKASSADVYPTLCGQAGDALYAGFPVIADAVFADPAERLAIERVAADAGVDFTALWLEAPPEQLEARLDQRSGDVSDAAAEVMRRQLNYDTSVIRWSRIAAGGSAVNTVRAAKSVLGI